MRAQRLTSPRPVTERPLRLEDVDMPAGRPGEVLVRVHACGICRTDLHVVEGDLPVRRPHIIPGHQVVGTIAAQMADDPNSPQAAQGEPLAVGARVGVAWLACTCGACRRCTSGRENLCAAAEFTGWTRDGGFAEWMTAPAAFVHALPDALDDVSAAPLLCAGIIGHRCLRLTGVTAWPGARIGLYGFGAAGHIAIQIARHRGAEVFVCTRDRTRHQALAEELGAAWVGDATATPPVPLDASIIFAPAGELVPVALAALDRGGTLVLGGIHMTPIPPLPYELLYHERVVRSVANNTREDARAFLADAVQAGVRTRVQRFALEEANDALIALKHDALRGAGVLDIASPTTSA